MFAVMKNDSFKDYHPDFIDQITKLFNPRFSKP
jgi:hypothetical protein